MANIDLVDAALTIKRKIREAVYPDILIRADHEIGLRKWSEWTENKRLEVIELIWQLTDTEVDVVEEWMDEGCMQLIGLAVLLLDYMQRSVEDGLDIVADSEAEEDVVEEDVDTEDTIEYMPGNRQ